MKDWRNVPASTNALPPEVVPRPTLVSVGVCIAIGWAALAPLTLPLPAAGGIRLAASDFLGVLTVAVVPFLYSTFPERAIRTLPVVCAFLWMFTCTFANLDQYPSAIAAIFRLLRGLFIFSPILLTLLIGDDLTVKERRIILDCMLLALLCGMVAGLVAYQIGWSVAPAQTYDFGRGQEARATGLMGDSSAFGHLGSTGAGLALCLLLVARPMTLLRATLCGAMLLLLPAFFYVSLSRALLVDLIVIIAALAILASVNLYDRIRVLGVIGSTTAVLLIGVGSLAAIFPGQSRTIAQRLDLGTVTEYIGDPAGLIDHLGSGRSSVWSDSIALAEANPVFGLGYKGLFTRYLNPGDNVFLSAFADLGVIGGLATILLVMWVLWLTLKSVVKSGRVDAAAAIAAPIWLGQIFHMCLFDVTTAYSSFPLILLVVGLALTAKRGGRDQSTASWRDEPCGFRRP